VHALGFPASTAGLPDGSAICLGRSDPLMVVLFPLMVVLLSISVPPLEMPPPEER
jgi:hypothetical protein